MSKANAVRFKNSSPQRSRPMKIPQIPLLAMNTSCKPLSALRVIFVVLAFFGCGHLSAQTWTAIDVGNVTSTSTAQQIQVDGVPATKVTTSGGTIYGNLDSFGFYKASNIPSVPLGTWRELTLELLDVGSSDPRAKAGLMIRKSTDSGEPFVYVYRDGVGKINVDVRHDPLGTVSSVWKQSNIDVALYRRIRVCSFWTRMAILVSPDGNQWTPLPIIETPAPLLLDAGQNAYGVAVCSVDSNTTIAAVFRGAALSDRVTR